MTNLEISAKVISVILAHLLATGIKKHWLNEKDLGLPQEERVFVQPCFEWLVAEGLVRCARDVGTDDGAAWIDPVLTSRGFAVLGTQLDFEGSQLTVAEIVERKGEVAGGYARIGDFLGGALGGFVKSMGS